MGGGRKHLVSVGQQTGTDAKGEEKRRDWGATGTGGGGDGGSRVETIKKEQQINRWVL